GVGHVDGGDVGGPGVAGVVDPDVEVEGGVDVDLLAVRAVAHRPRVLARRHHARAVDLAVVVVDHSRVVQVVGRRVDGDERLAVRADGRLPRVGGHGHAVECVQG